MGFLIRGVGEGMKLGLHRGLEHGTAVSQTECFSNRVFLMCYDFKYGPSQGGSMSRRSP